MPVSPLLLLFGPKPYSCNAPFSERSFHSGCDTSCLTGVVKLYLGIIGFAHASLYDNYKVEMSIRFCVIILVFILLIRQDLKSICQVEFRIGSCQALFKFYNNFHALFQSTSFPHSLLFLSCSILCVSKSGSLILPSPYSAACALPVGLAVIQLKLTNFFLMLHFIKFTKGSAF